MKNQKLFFALISASLMLASCSDDDPADPTVYRRVIGFENASGPLAGPTSYGANLYDGFTGGTQFINGAEEVEDGVYLEFGINSDAGTYNFWNGGIVRSDWNYRTDIAGQSAGWWYTFSNQCSVYNTASTDGANRGAGADGSNTFAVINGYFDANNNKSASFNFSGSKEYLVENIAVCPTSYLYGNITEGNAYGNDPGKSLKEVGGWFKVTATGYNAAGTKTATVEKYICDYRNASSPVEIASTWETWDVSAMGRVNKVVFNFEGSDTGQWGLNTPAYLAIDNITLRLN